jgi:lipopolysaccharide export LptBFGC system permease protein LptF
MKEIVIALTAVFISTFMLFFIFDNLQRTAELCRKGVELEICDALFGLGVPMLVILLLSTGFFLIIMCTAFVLYGLLR